MQESDNTLRILKETLEALKKEDSILLSSLSNQTMHSSTIAADGDDITTAVLVYSLSKLVQRKEEYAKEKGWDRFYKLAIGGLSGAIKSLERNDEFGFRSNLALINKAIEKISGKLQNYIKDVFEKAKINKASKIYEHGLSLEKTAKMLGVDLWELQSYTGTKEVGEARGSETLSTKSRIKLVENLFGMK